MGVSETAAQTCLACRTAAGAFPQDEVYRDERVVAVVAHHAINPGHLVIVSREHVRNALTMEPDLLCHMILVAQTLGRELLAAVGCDAVMFVFNNEAPCQTLFHAHLHVAPRNTGDAMDHRLGTEVAAEARARMAEQIRNYLHRNETKEQSP